MKKIVIITTTHTGYGHKALADSLLEWFDEMPDVEAKQIDGFERLTNRIAYLVGCSYGPTTRMGRFVWDIQWKLSLLLNRGIEFFMTRWSREKFLEMLKAEKPDVIVTTHPMFNTTLLNTMEKENIHIPFAALQADPVTLHPSWCDRRSDITFCATEEAVQCSMRYGVPREKISLIGFPTRKRFTALARVTEKAPYDPSRPAKCLLMSGGEGSGKLGSIAMRILQKTNVELTIICGRNAMLEKQLNTSLKPRFGDRVHIRGFVGNVDELMLENDLVIARGSPNTLYEAVVLNVPFIVSGALPGQEQGNLKLVRRTGIGVVCKSVLHVHEDIDALLKNGGEGLRAIQKNQLAFRDLDIAKKIAEQVAALGDK